MYRVNPRPAQHKFRKMTSLPHCAQRCSTEQGPAQACRCQCQCSVRLPLRHFAPGKPLGPKKKCSESLRLQGYPQSWFPPATSRARDFGLGPQAHVTCLMGGMAKAKVTCSIQCVPHLLGRKLWSLDCLLLLLGHGLQLHSVGTSSPLPAHHQRNVHRQWEEQGRGCFEIPAPILFIWLPQCPWHGSHL